MINSVRGKLTLWYILTVSVLIGIFSLMLYLTLENNLKNSIDIALFTEGKIIRNTLRRTDISNWNRLINEKKRDDLPTAVKFIRVVDIMDLQETNVIIAKTRSLQNHHFPLSQKAIEAALHSKFYFHTYNNPEDFDFPVRILTLVVPIEKTIPIQVQLGPAFSITLTQRTLFPYILQIGIPAKGLNSLIRKIRINIAIAVPILILIIALLGFQFIKKAFTPIREIVRTAQKITAQDLSLRIQNIQSHDEIGELAFTLNHMIERLENSFHQIRRFSSDVSHELKSPLTVIRGELQVLLKQNRNIEQYKQSFQSLLEETRRLENIINNLLLLSRLEQGDLKKLFTPLSLDEVLLESFENMLPLAKQYQIELILQEICSVKILGNSNLLTHIFSNLIQNAIKYNKEKGKVFLSIQKEDDRAIVKVQDTGIGIPKESIPHLFDRFYRVDKARSRESGGSGLGLALVKDITRLHGGKVQVESVFGKGSLFLVCFPSIEGDAETNQ